MPSKLSNSKAIHQAAQAEPSEKTVCLSFGIDSLKPIRINKFAGNLQNQQAER